jgi:hypothetical protein
MKKVRNGVIRALVEQGNIARIAGKIIAPKKGKGAKYNRKEAKNVDY